MLSHPPRRRPAILAILLSCLGAEDMSAQVLATTNDNRTPAGRMVNGELRIELEAVEAEWYPRGRDGARVITPAFAEVGGAPSIPGPLIRVAAGTAVHVTVHNRLASAIEVRGLIDRERDAGLPPGMPSMLAPFLFAQPLVIPAGEHRVTLFTPAADVSSFYFGRLIPADAPPLLPPFIPGGTASEGAFMGAMVVDDAAAPPHPDERIFVITRWGSPDEPNSLATSWKMMMNGQSWPHTERVDLTVGDTARWRIINTTMVDHPMHLHGFYFTVDAAGDTHADTVFASDARREVVTEMMQELSTLRVTWVPERAGNWLFHCHLIRHSGELQRFEADRTRAASTGRATHATHTDADAADVASAESARASLTGDATRMDMDGMAGMILGIRVQPAGTEADDPPPTRRLDLWTGSRPNVHNDAPELGFVIQSGAEPPAPDSTVVPGSTLVLTRGEPTEIVVYNRLEIPLSLHWHGLELRSLYDGVGHWSGDAGSVRPPIAPGESQHVIIEPPRAGTFFYHTHGEPGHELAQGLYGAFLVVEPGASWDRDTDRIFMLGSRGARIDAPPAINGLGAPGPERFQSGRTYRLRFAHISPDEFKRVRLLSNGEPVRWRAIAKDGADLPAARRVHQVASVGIGVGEAYDFEWVPDETGVYVLEVRTEFYPSRGGSAVQRVAFAVGDVDDESVRRATEGTIAAVELTDEQRRRYTGTFTGRLLPADDPREWILAVWEEDGRLYSSIAPRGEASLETSYLAPLGSDQFVPGTWEDDMLTRVREDLRFSFSAGADSFDVVEVADGAVDVFRFERANRFVLSDQELQVFVGVYGGGDVPVDSHVSIADGGLLLTVTGQPEWRLTPLAFDRFRMEGDGVPPGAMLTFAMTDGLVTGLVMTAPGMPPLSVPRKPER